MSVLHSQRLFLRVAVLAFVAGAVAGSPALGQTVTGSLVGSVSDSSGARLPGVTVTMAGPALMMDRTTVTGAQGSYRFSALPPGDYRLAFELAGFQRVIREAIRVRAGETFAVDVTLQLATVEEQVTVVGGSPLIDVRGSELDHTVGTEYIENLPINRRFSDLMNTLPGVTDGLYSFTPSNTVYGSSVRENNYTMDGLSTLDPVTRSPVTDVPYDDIEELQVTTAGFNAEFGQAAGGIFNFVTKSGGNSFSGTANFHLQNNSLQSDNISDALRDQGVSTPTSVDHVYDWGGNIGGPIVSDKLWFFQSYHKSSQEETQTEFPEPISTAQWQTLTKVSAQITDNNRFEGTYSRRDRNFTPFNFGFRTAADPKTWIGIGWINDAANFKWNSVLSENSLLEVRGGFALFDLLNLEPNVEAGHPIYIDRSTGIISGGPNGTFGTNNRDRYEWKVDFTHYWDEGLPGSHNFKVGLFSEELRSNTFRENQGDADDTQHFLFNGDPFRVRLYNTPLRQTTGLSRRTVYAQDEWTAHERLTLNIGVRIENSKGFLPESEFLGGRWQEAKLFPKQDNLFSPTVLAPRFGLVWDVTGDRKTTIRFSAGRFHHGLSAIEIGPASPTSVGFFEHDWSDLNGDLVYQPGEETLLRRDTTGGLPSQIDPDLKIPYTDMVSLGFDREITTDFAVTANFIYKDSDDIVQTTIPSAPFSAYNAVNVLNPLDNQPLTIFTLRPEFLGVPQQRFVTNPSDPLKIISRYRGLELTARKRMSDRWQMLLSYNFGKADGHLGTLFWDSDANDLYQNPNQQVNAFGPASLDRTHMFKVAASYIFPADIGFHVYYSALSGVPVVASTSGGRGVTGARFVRFFAEDNPGILSESFIDVPGEARGSNRHDSVNKFDFRVERVFRMDRGVSVQLQLDVFNLLNSNTVIRVQSLRTDQSNFLSPAQIMKPRAARIGVRVNF